MYKPPEYNGDHGMFLCTASDMHPYNCEGPEKCEHCRSDRNERHDPDKCALCNWNV